MSDINLPKLETPSSAVLPNEPAIFSMPEKYRGLTAKVNPPVVKPAILQTPAAVQAPPKSVVSPLLPKPTAPPLLKTRKNVSPKKKIAFIVIGIVILIGLAALVLWLFSRSAASPPQNNNVGLKNNNQSLNVNRNTNTNRLANNLNNSQLNTNQNTNNTNSVVSPFPQGEQPGRDSDSDGLTNAEEILYHTDSKLPDTDGDGFLDGNEVFHGYDPVVPSPAKLSATTVVTLYTSLDKKFSFYYPAVWTPKPAENNKGIVLVAPTGESFSITIQSKDKSTTLNNWYSGTNPSSTAKLTSGKTKQGYPTLITDNQMTVYVDTGDGVLIFDYQNTMKATVDFLTTFTMMINSFVLLTP